MTKVFATPTVAGDETATEKTEPMKEIDLEKTPEMKQQPQIFTVMPPHMVPLSSVHIQEPPRRHRKTGGACSTSCLIAAIVFLWITASAIIILYFGPECIFGKRLDRNSLDEKASTSSLRFIYDFAEPEAKPTNPQLPTTGLPVNNEKKQPRIIEINVARLSNNNRQPEQLPLLVVRSKDMSSSEEQQQQPRSHNPMLIDRTTQQEGEQKIPFQIAQIGGMRGILVPAESIFGRQRPYEPLPYQRPYEPLPYQRQMMMNNNPWGMQMPQQSQQMMYRSPMEEYNPWIMARLRAMRQRQMMMMLMQQQMFEQYNGGGPRFAQAPMPIYYYRQPMMAMPQQGQHIIYMQSQEQQQPQMQLINQERIREMFARKQQLQSMDRQFPVQMEPEGLQQRQQPIMVMPQQQQQQDGPSNFSPSMVQQQQVQHQVDSSQEQQEAPQQQQFRRPTEDEIFRMNQARAQEFRDAQEKQMRQQQQQQQQQQQPSQDEIYRIMQARAQEEQKMREQLQPSKQQQQQQPSQDDIYKALQAEALKLSQQQQQQQQPQPTRQTTTDEDAIFRAYQQQAMQMQKNQQPQAPMQIPPEAAKFIPTEMNNETEKVIQTNPIQLKLAAPKPSNVDEEPSTTTMATESSSTSASPPPESFPDITSSDATPPPPAAVVDSSEEQRPVGQQQQQQQQQPDPSEKISDYFKQLGMRRQPEIIVDGDTAASTVTTQATIVETSSDAQLSPAMRDFAQAAVAAVSEPEKKKTTEQEPFKMVKKA